MSKPGDAIRALNNRNYEALQSGEKPTSTKYKPAYKSNRRDIDKRREALEDAKIEADHE